MSQGSIYLRVASICCHDLDINNPMTLELEGHLKILKMYNLTEN